MCTQKLPANVRVGSIIEITDLSEESAFYEDYVAGDLPIVFRVTEDSEISEYGALHIKPIDPAGEYRYITCLFSVKYKVLWY